MIVCGNQHVIYALQGQVQNIPLTELPTNPPQHSQSAPFHSHASDSAHLMFI